MGTSWADWKSKKSSSWGVIFSYSMQQQWIISQSDCDVWGKVDFIWQLVTASSVIGPRRSSKALPKAKLEPRKMVLITVWWSAACLIHYSYLNPDEAIISEKYAQQTNESHWTAASVGIDQQKGPNSSPWRCLTAHHTTNASKVEWIGLRNFASSAIFT